MKIEPVEYQYQTHLKWSENKKGILGCEAKPDILVACPPEWGGHQGIWSPEDLFVGSVEVCVMTTFLWLAKKENVKFSLFESKATAIAQMVDNSFQFSSINIFVKLNVFNQLDKNKIEDIFSRINDWCVISKSIKPKVCITSQILIEHKK
jgi:organic hydroperoxide reductase OsmC/OhrA